MRRARSGRRGGVFIALTSVTLGTLLIATLMRLDWSSRALSEAGDGAGGAVAENLALSAVAEALWRFQTEGNQPDEPLFDEVRAKLRETKGPIDLSKGLAPQRLAKMLASGDAGGSFGIPTIESFQAILRPDDAPLMLVVKCTVRVDHGMGSFVRRTAREARRWGLNAVFAPQPLDQPTAALLHADVLARHVPALGRWQDAIRQFNRAVRDFRGLVDTVNALPPLVGKETVTMMPTYFGLADAQALTAEESMVVGAQRAAEPWREKERILEMTRRGGESRGYQDTIRDDVYFAGATPLRFEVERTLRSKLRIEAKESLYSKTLLEAEHAANALLSFAGEVDLERWDPNARFADALERSLGAFGPLGTRIGRLQARIAATEKDRKEQPDGGVQRFVADMDRALGEMSRTIANGTHALNELTKSMLAETRAPLAPPEEAGRAHPSISAHTGVTELPKWFKRFQGANGALAVRWKREEVERFRKENPDKLLPALELDLDDWQGKSLIDLDTVKTKIKVLHVEDQERDRIVLRAGPVTLDGGRVDAGLYVDSVSCKGAPDIQGALVVAGHPEKDGEEPRRLKGTVTHDVRLVSGVFVDGEGDEKKPDWRRVCEQSYVLILDPRGWERDVRQSRGKQ